VSTPDPVSNSSPSRTSLSSSILLICWCCFW
jgi:hypothetical protein